MSVIDPSNFILVATIATLGEYDNAGLGTWNGQPLSPTNEPTAQQDQLSATWNFYVNPNAPNQLYIVVSNVADTNFGYINGGPFDLVALTGFQFSLNVPSSAYAALSNQFAVAGESLLGPTSGTSVALNTTPGWSLISASGPFNQATYQIGTASVDDAFTHFPTVTGETRISGGGVFEFTFDPTVNLLNVNFDTLIASAINGEGAYTEQGTLTYAIDSWITGTAGDWSMAADWSSGSVPTSSVDALISNSNAVTVTGAAVADSLILNISTLTVSGSLTLNTSLTFTENSDELILNGGTLSAQSITSPSPESGYIYGYGTINASITGAIVIYATTGTLNLQGSIAGDSANLVINPGATLELGQGTSSSVQFEGPSGTLRFDVPAAFTGSIYAYAGDVIDLSGVSVSSVTYNGTTLTITESSSQQLSYNVTGPISGTPNIVADGGSGTNVYWPLKVSWNGAVGDWSNWADWSPEIVPTSVDDVFISNSNAVTVNGAAVAHSLMLDGSSNLTVSGSLTLGTSLAIDGGSNVNLSGGTVSAQSITSDNAGTLSGYGTVSGTIGGNLVVNATIVNNATFDFTDSSSAGASNISGGGQLQFSKDSTAGHAVISYSGIIQFLDNSSAGSAEISNGYNLQFIDKSTAGTALITNNSIVDFYGGGAGNANITNNDVIEFDGSSAASSTIINNAPIYSGGSIQFLGNSTGGQARLINNAGAVIDLSGLTVSGMSAGSIEGAGTYDLGGESLTVGANGLSTVVSGQIADGGFAGGVGGTLVKVGTGSLTLSGDNSYSGGTTVNTGTLVIGNDGALGSGNLSLAAGTTLSFTANADYTISTNIQISGDSNLQPPANTTQTIAGVISDGLASGVVTINGAGTLAFLGHNTYTGGTTIDEGTFDVAALSAAGANAISFGAGSGILQIDNVALSAHTFGNVISGFGTGDIIDLAGLAFVAGATATYNATTDTLTVTSNGITDTLNLVNPAGAVFKAISDGASGTEILLNPLVPTVSSVVASASSADLNAGKVVTLTVSFNEAVIVAGGTPVLQLNDHEVAIYTGGSGTSVFTFGYTVQPGDNVADLQVVGLNLPLGVTIQDAAGNNLSGSVTANLDLQIDTTPPTVTITSTGGPTDQSIQAVSGTVDVADAGTLVTLYDGTTSIGTAIVQANGLWSDTVTLVGAGNHTLTAQDTDAAGNIGTSNSVTYTLTPVSTLDSAQINDIYQTVLQRPASSSEISNWLALDASVGDAAVIADIVTLPEAEFNVYPVIQIIDLATLAAGQFPLARQLASWVPFIEQDGVLTAQAQTNSLLDQMALAFVASDNFGKVYNNGVDVDPNAPITGPIVTAIIDHALGSVPTPEHVAGWVATGLTIDQVFVDFALGDQYTAVSQSAIQQYLTTVADNAAGIQASSIVGSAAASQSLVAHAV